MKITSDHILGCAIAVLVGIVDIVDASAACLPRPCKEDLENMPALDRERTQAPKSGRTFSTIAYKKRFSGTRLPNPSSKEYDGVLLRRSGLEPAHSTAADTERSDK